MRSSSAAAAATRPLIGCSKAFSMRPTARYHRAKPRSRRCAGRSTCSGDKRESRLLSKSVLVTGGAGFIGSALAHRLVDAGYDVAAMDVLHPQVHAKGRALNLPQSVRLFTGDVTHGPDWDAVLRLFTPSQVVHLAAETGTAQSLSEATRHGSVNVVGTTQMLDALSRAELVPEQFVLASSRAVYGEGAWRCGENLLPEPTQPRPTGRRPVGPQVRQVSARSRCRVARLGRSPDLRTSTAPPNSVREQLWPPGAPPTMPNSACYACRTSMGQASHRPTLHRSRAVLRPRSPRTSRFGSIRGRPDRA